MLVRLIALFVAPGLVCGLAQDERRVASPDGRVEFRVRVADQAPGELQRLAYDVSVAGKPVIERSYLGVELVNQEPLLGEKAGLIGSHAGSGSGYNSLTANFMQDGSLARLIDVEARVYNDGIAFRYVLPRTPQTADLLIADDYTEFRFTSPLENPPQDQWAALPFVARLAAGVQVGIEEVRPPGFPAAKLARADANTLMVRLPNLPNDVETAYHGHAPYACPWRVILVGPAAQGAPWVRTLPLETGAKPAP